jgi:hypothetical protein
MVADANLSRAADNFFFLSKSPLRSFLYDLCVPRVCLSVVAETLLPLIQLPLFRLTRSKQGHGHLLGVGSALFSSIHSHLQVETVREALGLPEFACVL